MCPTCFGRELGPSHGFAGTEEKKPFISGEQGNKSLKRKRTGEQRQFWGTGNIESPDFDFVEQGYLCRFLRGTREQGLKSDHRKRYVSSLTFFMLPSKKLEGHIASGGTFVRPSVRPLRFDA